MLAFEVFIILAGVAGIFSINNLSSTSMTGSLAIPPQKMAIQQNPASSNFIPTSMSNMIIPKQVRATPTLSISQEIDPLLNAYESNKDGSLILVHDDIWFM